MTSEHAPAGTLFCAVLLLGGCAASPSREDAREYLDEQTAATVTVGPRTLVFARERPELAVHARDYLTLVPLDVNRSGSHAQYYYGYLWSTIDKRAAGDGADAEVPRFELIADGRRIPLVPVAGGPRDAGLGSAPIPAPARSARVLLAPTTREVLEFVADAAELEAAAVRDGVVEPFALWSR